MSSSSSDSYSSNSRTGSTNSDTSTHHSRSVLLGGAQAWSFEHLEHVEFAFPEVENAPALPIDIKLSSRTSSPATEPASPVAFSWDRPGNNEVTDFHVDDTIARNTREEIGESMLREMRRRALVREAARRSPPTPTRSTSTPPPPEPTTEGRRRFQRIPLMETDDGIEVPLVPLIGRIENLVRYPSWAEPSPRAPALPTRRPALTANIPVVADGDDEDDNDYGYNDYGYNNDDEEDNDNDGDSVGVGVVVGDGDGQAQSPHGQFWFINVAILNQMKRRAAIQC
ncbi:hypothetical protein A1O3_00222 [Capronia epimyces CBS 606.96]|uniref:Uncharacterized protein n=1 Tax=Capronia epimyces CBS 606.96 TaxID=1182542 RepID=W9YFK8_9EURO|nr:uncharacterized protein A1O3_00222 [Capronia epimyces CBS 606.96]EXJ91672.1 hypothetical protein A1O3_00222 [Capronia epimyces CBS 606.96]